MSQDETTVMGHEIQIDRSGQGHAWRGIDANDIPAAVIEEIEGEIASGKEAGEIVASNGQHYRWS